MSQKESKLPQQNNHQDTEAGASSGSGAETALRAMLKRRQMKATELPEEKSPFDPGAKSK